jgi:tRNA(adenine34) deaminase
MTQEPTSFHLAMMRLAIDQAHNAATVGEVPVGAVIVRDRQVIATGYNHPIGAQGVDLRMRGGIMRAAATTLRNYRLAGCDLYVTLEPCAMCCGAILHARIGRLFYGAPDPKTGACGSVIDVMAERRLNHHTTVQGGLLADDCGRLLSDFFVERRKAARRAAGAANNNAVPGDGIEVEFLDEPPDD